MKNYKELDIYKDAYRLAIDIHKMTLTLPKYELYEQGSQLRRSSKSIKDNIVEGYGRKRYKSDFIRFLVYAQSSCDEALYQITMVSGLHFTHKPLQELMERCNILGAKINKFIQYVETSWRT